MVFFSVKSVKVTGDSKNRQGSRFGTTTTHSIERSQIFISSPLLSLLLLPSKPHLTHKSKAKNQIMNDLLLNNSQSFDSEDSSRGGDLEGAVHDDDSEAPPAPPSPLKKKSMRAGAQGIFRSISSSNKKSTISNNSEDVLLIASADSVESIEHVEKKRSFGKNKTHPSVYLMSSHGDHNNEMAADDESVEGVSLDAYYARRNRRKRRKLCLVGLACLLVAMTLLGLVIGIRNRNNDDESRQRTSNFATSAGEGGCVNAISVSKTCFEFGEPIVFDISNCDPEAFDWGGKLKYLTYYSYVSYMSCLSMF
jgi:hypothetical protein